MYEKVPQELKELNQWVGWRLLPGDSEGDKPRKVPINPLTGEFAKSNDPASWSAFVNAERAVEQYKLTGIGIMFANDIFGVDIDHCIVDGVMEDFAVEIIEEVRSYTELSPSGTGIHILCRGTLPPGGRRRGAVEMYCNGRFFTVTGNQYGEPYSFNDCSERIKAMHEKYIGGKPEDVKITKPTRQRTEHYLMSVDDVVKRALNAKNGQKFNDLYSGNWWPYSNETEKQSLADMIFCGMLAFWCQKDSELMDTVFRRSGLMRPKWDKRRGAHTYGERTIQTAIAACNETWTPPSPRQAIPLPDVAPEYTAPSPLLSSDDELPTLAIPAQTSKPKFYKFDDTGNANRLRDENLGLVKFNCTEKQWVIWDGRRWCRDDTGEIKRRADMMLGKMQKELSTVGEELEGAYKKHIAKSRSHKGKEAFIKEAQHLDGIPLRINDWDDTEKVGNVMNIMNGIISLKTGLLKDHAPAYMITKLSPIVYDPEATCPLWERFLDDITCHDESLKLYLQRMVGYCMTESMREQVIFFLIGNGSNGKSTFVDTVAQVMGDYASSCSVSTIMFDRNRNDIVRPDLAELKGSRLVVTSEPNESSTLDEGMVKQLTSGIEEIKLRKLYGEMFSFTPKFKIIMSANCKPRIRGTDNGIWRRIRLIPFLAAFPDDKKDSSMPDKLKKELPGIFRWALEGAVGWYVDGLPPCPLIDEAVQEYRSEMDKVQQFMDDCTYADADSSLQSGVLYKVFVAWCSDQGDRNPIGNAKFAGKLKERYNRRKTSAYNEFVGVNFTEQGEALAVLVARQ